MAYCGAQSPVSAIQIFLGLQEDEQLPLDPSSTGALALKEFPKSMIVIEWDHISLEVASIWLHLGCGVTIVTENDVVPELVGGLS